MPVEKEAIINLQKSQLTQPPYGDAARRGHDGEIHPVKKGVNLPQANSV
jgi:hypothetical protein